jgi:hypothetical protein
MPTVYILTLSGVGMVLARPSYHFDAFLKPLRHTESVGRLEGKVY